MNIFVLIPAYNEKGNLKKLINDLENQLIKSRVKFKLFFVIQGDDGSKELLENLQKKKPFLDFVYYPKPLGIGVAYQIGYTKADNSADYILTMDADLNHDATDLPKFVKAMKDTGSDIVIGSRFIHGGKFDDKRVWKKIASRITNKIVTSILKLPIKDVSSGYRLIKKEVIVKLKSRLRSRGYPSYMEFILLAHKSGFKIKEIPIIYHPRIWGVSKINSASTIIDYIRFLQSILFNS